MPEAAPVTAAIAGSGLASPSCPTDNTISGDGDGDRDGKFPVPGAAPMALKPHLDDHAADADNLPDKPDDPVVADKHA